MAAAQCAVRPQYRGAFDVKSLYARQLDEIRFEHSPSFSSETPSAVRLGYRSVSIGSILRTVAGSFGLEIAVAMQLPGMNAEDYAQLLGFIRLRKLGYQPFRFDENHEVGEGMAFLAGNSADFERKGIINWPQPPTDISNLIVPPPSLEEFRKANDALRAIYQHFVASLCRHLGDDITGLDFAEYGCNTGYFLYSLGLRGARRAVGLDFTYNKAVFEFFNRKLGTNATFLFSEWDSFRHQPRYHEVPEVDVCLSIAVLCHLADPLHHLTYLCSRARKAVFVWTPSDQSDEFYISFGRPALFPNSLAWPVSFDNEVRPTRGMLELCLTANGFEDIRQLDPIATRFDAINFWQSHSGLIAFRTSETSTAYTGGALQRPLPSDVPVDEVYLEKDSSHLMPARRLLNEKSQRSVPPEESLAERTQRVASLEATLAERTRRLASLEATLAERTQRLGSLEATLAERTQRLASLEATLAERTQRLASLEATLAERTQRLASLEATLAERIQRFASLEAAPKFRLWQRICRRPWSAIFRRLRPSA